MGFHWEKSSQTVSSIEDNDKVFDSQNVLIELCYVNWFIKQKLQLGVSHHVSYKTRLLL